MQSLKNEYGATTILVYQQSVECMNKYSENKPGIQSETDASGTVFL